MIAIQPKLDKNGNYTNELGRLALKLFGPVWKLHGYAKPTGKCEMCEIESVAGGRRYCATCTEQLQVEAVKQNRKLGIKYMANRRHPKNVAT